MTSLSGSIIAMAFCLLGFQANATEPMPNPFLAQSSYSLAHANSAQTDSTTYKGPVGPTRELTPEEIRYHDLGVFNLAYLISGPYKDGKRVVWTNGSQFMTKFDYDTFDIISSLRMPGSVDTDSLAHEDFLKALDSKMTFKQKFEVAKKSGYPPIAGVYTMLDKDNQYIVCGEDRVQIYGDSTQGDRLSGIVVRAQWIKPKEITGGFIGMNMTYDGHIILATTDGYVFSLSRDLKAVTSIRLPDAASEIPKLSKGVQWIRNSFAIDDKGGIYIASNSHMHKVVWTGNKLSIDPKDHAWTEPYRNSLGNGTGSTPSLMGFGNDPDKLVVITDGDKLMNITAFWRDDIPENWKQVAGAPSRRIAGFQPATFGNPNLKAAQSEQSVVIAGYGMFIVNNEPHNVPADILQDRLGKKIVIGYLNHLKEVQPFGGQKFEWNPDSKTLKSAWVNKEVSSPNCVPFVSTGSDMVYLIGARNNQYTLEGIDWKSGKSSFHYNLGGSRYNSFYSQPIIDTEGRVMYGGLYGAVRLQPKVINKERISAR